MTLIRAALVMSAIAVAGCEGMGAVSPNRPRPRLSMAPPDVTSAVAATPLQVRVDNYAQAVGEDLLAPIADEIRLVSWPEGAPVAFTTQLQAFTPRREDGFDVFGIGTITVTPGAVLEDRWYFLHVAKAPATVELAGVMQLHHLTDGRAGVRFNPESEPRMTWVRRCPGDATAKIAVDFSEVVVLDSERALVVEASGASCLRPLVGNDSDRMGNSFSFACEPFASLTSVRVLVGSTVTGVGGHSVRGAGLPAEFPAAVFDPAGPCSLAAVPLE